MIMAVKNRNISYARTKWFEFCITTPIIALKDVCFNLYKNYDILPRFPCIYWTRDNRLTKNISAKHVKIGHSDTTLANINYQINYHDFYMLNS